MQQTINYREINNAVMTDTMEMCRLVESLKKSIENSIKIEDGVLKKCTDKGAVSVEIPEGVTEIGEKAFRACESLESVVIPPSVTAIGNSYIFIRDIYVCPASIQTGFWESREYL